MFNKQQNRAFTIVEILVVITIIALLVAFLMVAVQGGRDATNIVKSSVKLKQIGEWMQLWSGNNNDRVLPSQFDYTDEVDAGATISVRTYVNAPDDNLYDGETRGQYQGTWADILWTDNNLQQAFGIVDFYEDKQPKWASDSPNNSYLLENDSFDHPFRSIFLNTRGDEKGLPGYFAANDFFDSRSDNDANGSTNSEIDRYYTYSMLKSPSRSVYIVDSVVGETIGDEPEPWVWDFEMDAEGRLVDPNMATTGEVDYRYGGECMLLLLDGSIKTTGTWSERGPEDPLDGVDNSLYGLGYRVHDLTKRIPSP